MPRIHFVRPVAVLAASFAATLALGVESSTAAASSDPIVEKIQNARHTTWHWQRVMQRPLTPASRSPARVSDSFRQWMLRLWRERASRAYRRAIDPPHERQFRCIHRHEGPWDANTGNGYYGGLQMDIAFQRDYARRLVRTKGRAHRWTPLEQIWAGEHALRAGRGFYPWPVAARSCGVI